VLNSESHGTAGTEDTPFVEFWNAVLAPKFIRFKHILVGGLTQHSEAIFPNLPVREGNHVLDVGCGFGDTAIKLARLVGPGGEVVGTLPRPGRWRVGRGARGGDQPPENLRRRHRDAELVLGDQREKSRLTLALSTYSGR
jgi:SAM-dependent methyltransferase